MSGQLKSKKKKKLVKIPAELWSNNDYFSPAMVFLAIESYETEFDKIGSLAIRTLILKDLEMIIYQLLKSFGLCSSCIVN